MFPKIPWIQSAPACFPGIMRHDSIQWHVREFGNIFYCTVLTVLKPLVVHSDFNPGVFYGTAGPQHKQEDHGLKHVAEWTAANEAKLKEKKYLKYYSELLWHVKEHTSTTAVITVETPAVCCLCERRAGLWRCCFYKTAFIPFTFWEVKLRSETTGDLTGM